jgi:hypothetical protein
LITLGILLSVAANLQANDVATLVFYLLLIVFGAGALCVTDWRHAKSDGTQRRISVLALLSFTLGLISFASITSIPGKAEALELLAMFGGFSSVSAGVFFLRQRRTSKAVVGHSLAITGIVLSMLTIPVVGISKLFIHSP